MDYRILIFGGLILIYGLIDLGMGKALVPAWFMGGILSRNKHQELYWLVVMVKFLLGGFLIFKSIV